MAASVRVEDEAFSDLRFEVLGALLKTSKFDALGRMAHLWRQCTALGTYELPPALVEVVADPAHVVAADLAEWVFPADHQHQLDGAGPAAPAGSTVEPIAVRIRGTGGRIEWLNEKRSSASKGGRARAKQAKRGSGGRFAPAEHQRVLDQRTSTPPASAGPAAPALSSPPAPAPALGITCQQSGRPTFADALPEPKPEPPEAYELTRALRASILERQPTNRSIRPGRWDRTRAQWAKSFRLAHERDGRSWEDLRAVLDWSQRDEFWSGNILSAQKLREKFDTLDSQRRRASGGDGDGVRVGSYRVTGREQYGNGPVEDF